MSKVLAAHIVLAVENALADELLRRSYRERFCRGKCDLFIVGYWLVVDPERNRSGPLCRLGAVAPVG